MNKRKIHRNAVKCKHCQSIIESLNVYELIYCKCRKVAVDGGQEYLRRLGEEEDYEEMSECSEK